MPAAEPSSNLKATTTGYRERDIFAPGGVYVYRFIIITGNTRLAVARNDRGRELAEQALREGKTVIIESGEERITLTQMDLCER